MLTSSPQRWLAALLVAGLLQPTTALAASDLEVGLARRDITPDVDGETPVWIAGYGNNRRATGVHDPLYATAVVFSDGQRQIAFATLDLVGLQRPDVQRIRAGLDGFDYVLIASTHNHEGPDVVGIWGPHPLKSGVDPQYIDQIVAETIAAINEAATNLRPAEASYGTSEIPADWLKDARLPIVRDQTLRTVLLHEPGEPKKRIGLVVQYSCHPESLASRNTLITADFPAATIAALEAKYDCPVAYFTGAVGGLMTHPDEFVDDDGQAYQEGTFEYADAYGKAIARKAEEAVDAAKPIALAPIRIAQTEVAAPLSNVLYQAARAAGVLRRGAVVYEGNWRSPGEPATASTPVDRLGVVTEVALLALGDLGVAAVPGEIYPELVHGEYQDPVDPNADYPDAPLEPTVAEAMPQQKWLLLGLANDEIGYIIPKRQWDTQAPYAYDREKAQYGETNSCGVEIAPILMKAFQETGEQLRQQLSEEPRASTVPRR